MPKKKTDETMVEETSMQAQDMPSLEELEEAIDGTDSEELDETDETEEAPKPAPKRTAKKGRTQRTGREATMEDGTRKEGSVGINRASRKKQRELYSENVFSINADDPANSAKNELHDTFLELAASYQTGRILTGELAAVTEIGGIPCGIVYYNEYTVYISQKHLFVLNEEQFQGDTAEQIRQYKRYYTQMRLHSEVQFVILQVDETEAIAYGSAVKAAELNAQQYFLSKNERNKSRISVGDKVEGVITYVMKSGIGISFQGIETYVNVDELSYLYIDDVRTELDTREKLPKYQVGNRIVAVVKSIEPYKYRVEHRYNQNGKILEKTSEFDLIRLRVSVKEAYGDPNIEYFGKPGFRVGDRPLATVTGRSESGYHVRLAGKRDALMEDSQGMNFKKGTKVVVKINKTVPSTYKIYCRPVSVAKWVK